MIKAGTIWTHPEGTIEWLKDVHAGDTLNVGTLLIDGRAPDFGDSVPKWAHRHEGPPLSRVYFISVKPPDDVVVTLKA